MSSPQVHRDTSVTMKLEIVVIPVSNVDTAKSFYANLGWRLDADFVVGDDYRVIQFTPPGSDCSVIFGKNVTAATPGSAQGLYLIVSDIEAARADLLGRGVKVSDAFHAGDVNVGPDEPYLFGRLRVNGPIPRGPAIAPSHHSATRTATAGCFRRSPRDCPDVSMPAPRLLTLLLTSQPPCGGRRSRMANTRSAPAASMTRTGRTGMPTISCASRPASRCRHSGASRCTWNTSQLNRLTQSWMTRAPIFAKPNSTSEPGAVLALQLRKRVSGSSDWRVGRGA
jgi:catechol 2,3-dioxygenase-like lactoylglutathione lyase family enzyme